nr:choice-of-anchor P family protein [Amycolatopsis taiwanensis]
MSRRTVLAGRVGVLSAVLVTGALLAPVAGATEGKAAGTDSAFAISGSGLLRNDRTPSVDDSDGFAEASLAQLKLPLLADLGALNARAGAGQSRASVAALKVGLGLGKPVLTASAVEADCDRGKVSSSLAKAKLGDIPLDVQAPPNTTVKVPGLLSVTLNKQVRHHDGTVTVTAVSINVDNLQTLDLASATCVPAESDGGTTVSDPTPPNGAAPTPTPVPAHLDVTG